MLITQLLNNPRWFGSKAKYPDGVELISSWWDIGHRCLCTDMNLTRSTSSRRSSYQLLIMCRESLWLHAGRLHRVISSLCSHGFINIIDTPLPLHRVSRLFTLFWKWPGPLPATHIINRCIQSQRATPRRILYGAEYSQQMSWMSSCSSRSHAKIGVLSLICYQHDDPACQHVCYITTASRFTHVLVPCLTHILNQDWILVLSALLCAQCMTIDIVRCLRVVCLMHGLI